MDSFIKTFVSCYFLIWKTFLEVINNGLGLFLSFSLYRYTVGRPHKLGKEKSNLNVCNREDFD